MSHWCPERMIRVSWEVCDSKKYCKNPRQRLWICQGGLQCRPEMVELEKEEKRREDIQSRNPINKRTSH